MTDNCSYCNKLCKNANSLRNHERLCKHNPDYEKNIKGHGAFTPEAREKAMETKRRRGTISNGAIKAKQEGRPFIVTEDTRKKLREAGLKQVWTEERREAHRSTMRGVVERHPESYSTHNVCGRVKRIEYNGSVLLGKWELEVAKALDKENIKWTNEMDPFKYEWDGSVRKYFPDFYLPDMDLYIEVKGYERDRDRAKWSVVPNLRVLKRKEIEILQEGSLITELL